MRVYVYTGPTLSHLEGQNILNAYFQPPIKHGDIFNAIEQGAQCLAIIDGYYDTMAACRHKEILQALNAGIRVLGSSSMGAMRAAELDLFGMEGIGEIYHMYKSGVIDGDDEVAIKHTPENEGFKTLNIPLVNLRYNLQKMIELQLITPLDSKLLLHCAKEMYFGSRNLRFIFNRAKQQGLSQQVIEKCQSYFQDQWFDLKKSDAHFLLKTISQRISGQQSWPQIKQPQINQTSFLYKWNVDQAKIKTRLGDVGEHEVLAQLKFATTEYPRYRQLANEKSWLVDYAQRLNIEVSSDALIECKQQFYEKEQINNEDNQKQWLSDHELTKEQLLNFLQREAILVKLDMLRACEAPNPSMLLLEYANLRGLSTYSSEIDTEWQYFCHELTLKAIDFSSDKLSTLLNVDLALPPAKTVKTSPPLLPWCQEHNIAFEDMQMFLSKRNLLRKFALNFYISPGIIFREPIVIELKVNRIFHKALEELLSIYEGFSKKGINTEWHPQWKFFVQPDIRVILQSFCKKEQLQPKVARNYISWKGFDDFMEFIDIAQLNYI
ncbi:MAG: hypothetical protein FD167_17 [bacterium]|nr:MAG: hypothetical protein FD167_17 [bacterium]